MIIIRFQGGIGNQLFQYALYKELEYLGKDVYADLSIFNRIEEPRKFELHKLGIRIREAKVEEVWRMCPPGKSLFARVKKNTVCRKRFIKEKNSYLFDSRFLEYDNKYLIGYWQTEKYFEDVVQQLRGEINFMPPTDEKNMAILKKIHSTNSISVHMRFGDYVNNPIYDNICTDRYYLAAIEEMRMIHEDAVFYVISDDTEKAREVLNRDDYEYVDWNRGDNSYYDMYLISQCRHNILANSSFSWWGTWLNENEDKMVIAPSVWVNGTRTDDVVSNSWIKISPKGELVHECHV